MSKRAFLAAIIGVLAAAAFAAPAAELRLGTTHTLQDSGILDLLVHAYERDSGVRVKLVVAGTGQVIRYAEKGDVDAVLSHSRVDEERLVASGVARARLDAMHNDFVIAGPQADPARIAGMADAAAALRRIREAGARFVSRGDDSGTHKKELQLWAAGGGLASWSGYLRAGQGAARTLMMAHELDAYDLVDRATLRLLSRRHPLKVLVERDPRLLNEYAVLPLRAAPGRAVNEAEAERFASWLVSPAARQVIGGYAIGGQPAFHLPPR